MLPKLTVSSAELCVGLGAVVRSVRVDALGSREASVPVVSVEDCDSESNARLVASVEEAGRKVSGDGNVDVDSALVAVVELMVG